MNNFTTDADVILVCEKDKLPIWLIDNGIISIDGVNVLLASSRGQADTAFRATISKYICIKSCVFFSLLDY